MKAANQLSVLLQLWVEELGLQVGPWSVVSATSASHCVFHLCVRLDATNAPVFPSLVPAATTFLIKRSKYSRWKRMGSPVGI